jgi:hypothetical protein
VWSPNWFDPETMSPMKMARLAATSAIVTTGRVASDRSGIVRCRPDRAHSGQWKPTDAWFMHDGQMGRSQRWQRTPARRSPCR